MQIIYIDTLICVNLFIDYILLCITKKILHINAKMYRILLGAVTGAISTLTAFLPFHSVFLSALYKIGTTTLIIIISFGKGTFRKTIVRLMTFLGFSMILSTSVVLINDLWSTKKVIIYNDALYFDISPVALLITTAIVYIILSLYNKLSSVHKLRCEVHKITLSTDKVKRLTFETAIDTGCNLKEPFSGLPVILTEEDVLSGIDISEEKMRVIPYRTAAGSAIIQGFKPNYIDIDGKVIRNGCYIGICKDKLNGEIKSIMGTELLEVI